MIPRYAGDGFSINAAWEKRDQALLDADAEAVSTALAAGLGGGSGSRPD